MIRAVNRMTRMGTLAVVSVLTAFCGRSAQGAPPIGRALSMAMALQAAVEMTPLHRPTAGLAHPAALPPPPALPSPALDPGTLPQTRVLPTTDDLAFQDRARAFWQAIVDDRPEKALPFFFPKTAYRQVKAIRNADSDYDYRLIGYYELDVHAAHTHLGADAATASFAGIDVPARNAEWMPPGTEENKESYYRVYGTRLGYTVSGRHKSLGVFSMLSWRGQWYAVHFGPWPRWERSGAVDDPR